MLSVICGVRRAANLSRVERSSGLSQRIQVSYPGDAHLQRLAGWVQTEGIKFGGSRGCLKCGVCKGDIHSQVLIRKMPRRSPSCLDRCSLLDCKWQGTTQVTNCQRWSKVSRACCCSFRRVCIQFVPAESLQNAIDYKPATCRSCVT